MSVRLVLSGAVSCSVGRATRVAVLLAPLLVSLPAETSPPRPGRAVTVTVEDPCPALAARGKGKSVRIGGVNLDLEALYFASCDYLKGQIAESVESGAGEIQGKFADTAWGAAEALYKDFLAWLRPVAARELGLDPASPGFDVSLRAWVTDPNTAVASLVDAFLAERSPRVSALLERVQGDTSREIAEGLGTLWEDAKDRFERFNRAYAEIERDPKTPYADILVNWGLSGPWVEKFQSYEHRFNVFDDRTRLLDASKTLYEALSADRHRDRIAGLFSLLETVGDAAKRSDVPGVSFFGQVVALYGQMANELLRKVNALEDLLRRREGYCIGLATHTLEEARSLAFRRQFGEGLQACPVDPKLPLEQAVYQQTEPADADQLYFWIEGEGRFVRGQARGGGMRAVLVARHLIGAGAELGFAELAGRKDDLAAVSAFYNTPYRDALYGDGLAGVWSEAVTTIDGIERRLGELERAMPEEGDGCNRDALRGYLRAICGLDAGSFPRGEEESRLKLTNSFALGAVAAANPQALASQRSVPVVERYRRAWTCLRPLSLLHLEGAVQEKGALGHTCGRCAGAGLQVRIQGGVELPGCGARRTDDRGRFDLWIATRTSGLAVTLSADVEGRRSDTVVVDARSAPLEPFPFGVREERVVVPVELEGGGKAPAEAVPPTPAPAPERLEVPDLSGMSVDEAGNALRAAGLALVVGSMRLTPPTPHLASRVGTQRPLAGSAARRGDRVEVTLYAATTVHEYEVPSLVGLPEADALARLKDARLAVAIDRSAPPPSPSLAGRVYAQHPLAGTRVGFETTVRIQVYAAAGPVPQPPAPVPSPSPVPPPPLPPPPSPPPVVPPAPPPGGEEESLELAGVWDTGRGMVVRIQAVAEGRYSGTLVRVTKPLRAFFWQPGETMMNATRTGTGAYLVAMLVRLGNGKIVAGPEATVHVRGDSAQAANATWRRVGPP